MSARSMSSIHTYILDKCSVDSNVQCGYEHFACGDWKGQE